MTQLLGSRGSRGSELAMQTDQNVGIEVLGPLVSGSFDQLSNINGVGMNYAEYRHALKTTTHGVTIDRVSDDYRLDDEGSLEEHAVLS